MEVDDIFRVLVICGIADTREHIRKLLQFDKDMEVVASVNAASEGIELAIEEGIDVVLIDSNVADIDYIEAIDAISKGVPSTQIVVFSDLGDPNDMRKAMLAGARDYLIKPFSAEELLTAIKRAGNMAHEERLIGQISDEVERAEPYRLGVPENSCGKIISVYSPKGGTGCTTLAVNLAITLHNEETQVILVDGNLQFGDIAVFLNEECQSSVTDLAPYADDLNPQIVEKVIPNHTLSGVKILAAPSRPEFAEDINGEQFTKILKYLCQSFDYVVVDTSSTITEIVLASILVSDLVILLTDQMIPSVKSARLFLDLAAQLGVDQRRILFIMNKYDKRIAISPQKIGERFIHEIVAIFPFNSNLVIPSINRGVPFMLENKSSQIATVMLSLVDIIHQRITEIETNLN